MVKTEGKRTRPGDLFLLAILLANLVCGVGLIGALRADLSKDLVAGESTLVSSKISAYPVGKDPPVHLRGGAGEEGGGERAGQRGRQTR